MTGFTLKEINTHAQRHKCTHAHTHARTHAHTRTHARTHARTHIQTNRHTNKQTKLYPCTLRTHARTHTRSHEHTYKQTDTHQQTKNLHPCTLRKFRPRPHQKKDKEPNDTHLSHFLRHVGLHVLDTGQQKAPGGGSPDPISVRLLLAEGVLHQTRLAAQHLLRLPSGQHRVAGRLVHHGRSNVVP